ncbi:MAG: hypothetical protein LBT98_04020 [Puniceicoccales bacterium]|jgi:hypothetical protein|nr:hypothetical protein [Puniceicoccales bacterium]
MNRRYEIDWKNLRCACPEKGQSSGPVRLCGAPVTDFGAVQKSWQDFQARALPAMVEWAQKAPSNVQYDDVLAKVKAYSPPYAHEGYFCGKVLLPKLEELGKMGDLSSSLIAILYSIHLSSAGMKLLSCKANGSSRLVFSAGLRVQNIHFVNDYKVDDYLHPKEARLEIVRLGQTPCEYMDMAAGEASTSDGHD